MRLEIRYVTDFSYRKPVRESHNELRACPAELPHQEVMGYRLSIDPPARVHTFTDFWGTRVDAFGVRGKHDHLRIVADATVTTAPPPQPADDPGRDTLDEKYRAGHSQYLTPSTHTQGGDAIAAAARDLAARASGVVDLAQQVMAGVHDHLDYAPGATYVGVDVNDVFVAAKGVCQDYAHLSLAMYRGLGVAARYVSGYFYAADQSRGDAPEDAEIEVQTHAWVEVAVPGFGWLALDPTNRLAVGERHVKIGHGRDYDDVLPLRGVFHGPADHELGVSVRMTREQMAQAQQ